MTIAILLVSGVIPSFNLLLQFWLGLRKHHHKTWKPIQRRGYQHHIECNLTGFAGDSFLPSIRQPEEAVNQVLSQALQPLDLQALQVLGSPIQTQHAAIPHLTIPLFVTERKVLRDLGLSEPHLSLFEFVTCLITLHVFPFHGHLFLFRLFLCFATHTHVTKKGKATTKKGKIFATNLMLFLFFFFGYQMSEHQNWFGCPTFGFTRKKKCLRKQVDSSHRIVDQGAEGPWGLV